MKSKVLAAFIIITFIFSCKSAEEKVKIEVDNFKGFADSLLAVNKNYVEVLYADTSVVGAINAPAYEGLKLGDTLISLHSNIFDTFTEFTKNKMMETIVKYDSLEHRLDSLESNMDEKTKKLFELLKQKINTIKQPVK